MRETCFFVIYRSQTLAISTTPLLNLFTFVAQVLYNIVCAVKFTQDPPVKVYDSLPLHVFSFFPSVYIVMLTLFSPVQKDSMMEHSLVSLTTFIYFTMTGLVSKYCMCSMSVCHSEPGNIKVLSQPLDQLLQVFSSNISGPHSPSTQVNFLLDKVVKLQNCPYRPSYNG